MKIIIYASAIAILHYLPVDAHNGSLRRFLTIVEIVLFALILRTIIPLMNAPVKNLAKQLKKALSKIFKPVLDKVQKTLARRRKFIKGIDEKNLIWNGNLNIISKLKNKLKSRKKLDFKHSASHMEKIRLLYIKLILILLKKNHKIKYSYTVKEIKDNLDCGEKYILFDVYEQVRYSRYIIVSDDMVNLCQNDIDGINMPHET